MIRHLLCASRVTAAPDFWWGGGVYVCVYMCVCGGGAPMWDMQRPEADVRCFPPVALHLTFLRQASRTEPGVHHFGQQAPGLYLPVSMSAEVTGSGIQTQVLLFTQTAFLPA